MARRALIVIFLIAVLFLAVQLIRGRETVSVSTTPSGRPVGVTQR